MIRNAYLKTIEYIGKEYEEVETYIVATGDNTSIESTIKSIMGKIDK